MRILFDLAELPTDEARSSLANFLSVLVRSAPDDEFEAILDGHDIKGSSAFQRTLQTCGAERLAIRHWFDAVDADGRRTHGSDVSRSIRAALIGSRQGDVVVTHDVQLAAAVECLFPAARRPGRLPDIVLIERDRDLLDRSGPTPTIRVVRLPGDDASNVALSQTRNSDRPDEASGRLSVGEFLAYARNIATGSTRPAADDSRRPSLAYVTTGPIGDDADEATTEMLRALSEFYYVVVFGSTDRSDIAEPAFRSLPLAMFEDTALRFHRILYALADAEACIPVYDALLRWPGVVHLQDPGFRRLLSAAKERERSETSVREQLFFSHGYQAIRAIADGTPEAEVIISYPPWREIVEAATGVFVSSTAAIRGGARVFGSEAVADWTVVRPNSKAEETGSLLSAAFLDQATRMADSAALLVSAIERSYEPAGRALANLVEDLRARATTDADGSARDAEGLARALAATFPSRHRRRRLYVDVSAICRHDVHTGIQRVVRAIALLWLKDQDADVSIMPVYLSNATGRWTHHHATRWASHLLGIPRTDLDGIDDTIAEMRVGDILFILDFTGPMLYDVEAREAYYQGLRNIGVFVSLVVYDLLPLRFPRFFPSIATEHSRWIAAAGELADQLLCISQAVADDVNAWFTSNGQTVTGGIDVFHLGADVQNSLPTTGIDAALRATIETFASRPTFLMVGTVEPRKGQAEVLDAFDHLWTRGLAANLVIIGKLGWMSDRLKDRLDDHECRNTSLFWLSGLSDEALLAVYRKSDCLIAASYGEGFGLPLIEAAQEDLAIIARDIPVFREIAGDHAFYFGGETADDFGSAIEAWLRLYEANSHPKSTGMPWLTWRESAAILLEKVKSAALDR